jgi:hypothetical protein
VIRFTMVLFVILIGACRAQDAPISKLKLIGGDVDTRNKFPSVLYWTTEDDNLNEGTCTGTKISDHLILTAAHCVVTQDPNPGETFLGPWMEEEQLSPGSMIQFSFKKTIFKSTKVEWAEVLKIHLPDEVASCVKDPEQDPDFCQFRVPIPDVAAIEIRLLDSNSEFAYRPAAEVAAETPEVGSKVTMLGYGEEAVKTKKRRLKYSHQVVSSMSDLFDSLIGTYAEEDGFPKEQYFFGIGSNPERNGHANLGFGDSGGPLYANGAVAGINSDGYCKNPNRYCTVATNSIFAKIPYGLIDRWKDESSR